MNQVILLGNLGRDPEIKYTTGGKAVATLSLATKKSWVDAGGNRKEKTSWHRIQAWGHLAEKLQAVGKGTKLFVTGELDTRTWNDQAGKKHYITEVNATEIFFTGSEIPRTEAEPEAPLSDEEAPF